MDPAFFSSPTEFRAWFEQNHLHEKELWVGYYKADSGKRNMTWSESVDQALCFGWIDGIRKSIDGERYCIRFTPRKRTSIWSAINIEKVRKLTSEGLMRTAGLEAFQYRKEERSKVYSFESDSTGLPESLEKQFRAHDKAWAFFTSQPPSYRKMMFHWILSAKLEATRVSRLDKVIAASAEQVRLFDKYR
jgi:uncharacterized protein YdeI (YjbR/CyaY-like superfamily)